MFSSTFGRAQVAPPLLIVSTRILQWPSFPYSTVMPDVPFSAGPAGQLSNCSHENNSIRHPNRLGLRSQACLYVTSTRCKLSKAICSAPVTGPPPFPGKHPGTIRPRLRHSRWMSSPFVRSDGLDDSSAILQRNADIQQVYQSHETTSQPAQIPGGNNCTATRNHCNHSACIPLGR